MKSQIITLIVLILGINSSAQTVESILMGYENQIEKKHLISEISYTLYEDYESDNILEELDGLSIKNGNQFYTKIGPTEFIFSSNYSLKISNTEKIIVIGEPSLNDRIFNLDITTSLSELFENSKVEDKGSYWECGFISKKDLSLPYNKCVLHIAKEDFQLLRQVLFFSSPINHTYKEKDPYTKNQRLEIGFKNLVMKDKSLAKKTLVKSYVANIGSEFKAIGSISDYLVINAMKKQFNQQ